MFGIGRNRKAFAGVFAIDGHAIVFPLRGIASALDLGREVVLADASGLGRAALEALELPKPLRDKSLSLGEQTRAFEDRMEAFRLASGVSRARFARGLRHAHLLQVPDSVTVTGMRPARGRYAFEGGGPKRVLAQPEGTQPDLLGQALVAVLA